MKFKLVESVDNLLLEKMWVGLQFEDAKTGRIFRATDPTAKSISTDIIYFYSTNDVSSDTSQLDAYFKAGLSATNTPNINFAKQSLRPELKAALFDFYKRCSNNVNIKQLPGPVTVADLLASNYSVLSITDRDLRKKNTKYVEDTILKNPKLGLSLDKFLIHHPEKNEYDNNNIWLIPYSKGEVDLAHAVHRIIENSTTVTCSESFNIYHFIGGTLVDTKTVNITIT